MKRAIVILFAFFFIGCANIKPYHQVKLNHKEMQLGDDPMENHEKQSQNYREGASGGDGGKTGGGCGCN